MPKSALEASPPLTEKQAACLKYVLTYFVGHGYYPTHREVAAAMSLRSSAAEVYLLPLVRKGYLVRKPRRHRNIKLTQAGVEKLEALGVNAHEQLMLR